MYTPPSDPLFVGQVMVEYEMCIADVSICDKTNITISVVPSVIANDDTASAISAATATQINALQNYSTNPSDQALVVKTRSHCSLKLPGVLAIIVLALTATFALETMVSSCPFALNLE